MKRNLQWIFMIAVTTSLCSCTKETVEEGPRGFSPIIEPLTYELVKPNLFGSINRIK